MAKKVLIAVLAYQAVQHIDKVLSRIPPELNQSQNIIRDIVIFDDASTDGTSEKASTFAENTGIKLSIQKNTVNLGYGGNQKNIYQYAMRYNYDVVIILHGDNQYPPEMIDELIRPIISGEAEAVLGSRMLILRDAIRGGMPLYKFIGNIIITKAQNALLGTSLSEFHTGFRAYSVAALAKVPFVSNSDYFDFDTEIIIQFVDNKLRISEIAIPTHYGDEECRVNGVKYAFLVIIKTIASRLNKYGLVRLEQFVYSR